jgi:hypothetical protein
VVEITQIFENKIDRADGRHCVNWKLSAESHTACIGVIRRAGGHRKHADARCSDLVLGGGRGSLRCGGCASEDENNNERSDKVFHGRYPFSCIR